MDVTTNLRTALAIFQAGFLLESVSGFAALIVGVAALPFHGAILLVGPAFSGAGVLFLWIGRHEWNETHAQRVGHATLAFAVTLVALLLAALPVAILTAEGSSAPPAWAAWEFGAAVALVIGASFLTYGLVAAHLVGRTGRVGLAASLLWAWIVAAVLGLLLAPQLGTIVHLIQARSGPYDSVTRPLGPLEALLAISYLAFFVLFSEAHYRVARGRPVEGSGAGPVTPTPGGEAMRPPVAP